MTSVPARRDLTMLMEPLLGVFDSRWRAVVCGMPRTVRKGGETATGSRYLLTYG
jgi:hypothetical protein